MNHETFTVKEVFPKLDRELGIGLGEVFTFVHYSNVKNHFHIGLDDLREEFSQWCSKQVQGTWLWLPRLEEFLEESYGKNMNWLEGDFEKLHEYVGYMLEGVEL